MYLLICNFFFILYGDTTNRPYSMNDELHLFTFNWNRINGIPPVLVY